ALDRVLWIPAGEPPHKRAGSVTPAHVRLAMVREAAAADERFEVATLELERPGPSYTVDSVRALRRSHPEGELFLIVGADQVATFDTWRDPGEIVREARLAVMDRGGESAAAAAGAHAAAADAVVVPVRRIDVSSTEVRERVRDGLDFAELVPPGVRTIIERERLYSTA
ncbi:MAG TPA: nicotinate (nicotinamide) nucleotide adenylyltransferase, partial [Candidatus Limnocylindrales bacterium]|nr:nicotinate (nicotinamide) nucleotide adenylyltransferase [Candidatus Limnocylindrales bacterium]